MAILGLDLGGTKILSGKLSDSKEIEGINKILSPTNLETALTEIKKMLHASLSSSKCEAIGVSAGGPLDWQKGSVSSFHLPEWNEVPLAEILSKEFGVPVYVEVDTDACALAEHIFSKIKVARLLYLTISTGMGGGFLLDGELYRGKDNGHPEVAHHEIPYRINPMREIRCKCGGLGCLESLVSGSGLKAIYNAEASELGDEIWKDWAYNLGTGLRNLVTILSPDLIILGGSVALGKGASFIKMAEEVMKSRLSLVRAPEIRLSSLKELSGLYGAFASALTRSSLNREVPSV